MILVLGVFCVLGAFFTAAAVDTAVAGLRWRRNPETVRTSKSADFNVAVTRICIEAAMPDVNPANWLVIGIVGLLVAQIIGLGPVVSILEATGNGSLSNYFVYWVVMMAVAASLWPAIRFFGYGATYPK